MANFLTQEALFKSQEMHEAMVSGLVEKIRTRLRERILERIAPDVEAAIDAAIEAFKVQIDSYREDYHMRDTLRILVERKDDRAA